MKRETKALVMVACFALLNVIMYATVAKFWIGGSSFLPMIGKLGEGNKFLFAFLVNMGVIAGSFIGAISSKEFIVRKPKKENLMRAVAGGFLIGMGITLAPGTCTTAFVIGLPMLSVSSVLSVVGICVGAYIAYMLTMHKCSVPKNTQGEKI